MTTETVPVAATSYCSFLENPARLKALRTALIFAINLRSNHTQATATRYQHLKDLSFEFKM